MSKSLSMLGVVLLLGFPIVAASQATALTITQLSNQSVGHPAFPATACVDVGGALTANGTPVGPFPCNNQFNEQWIYSNGWFLGIGTTGFGTGAVNKCLSVRRNSTLAGARVELDTCISGNRSQLWEAVINTTSGHSVILNIGSAKCLDSQGQIGGGLQLVINLCNASAVGQVWDLK